MLSKPEWIEKVIKILVDDPNGWRQKDASDYANTIVDTYYEDDLSPEEAVEADADNWE